MIGVGINKREDQNISVRLLAFLEALIRLLPVLGILFTLLIAIWTIQLIPKVPYVGMDWSYQSGKVIDIAPEGPASKQIKINDHILAFDGIPTFQARGLPGYSPGDTVWVRIKRGESEINKRITLGTSPAQLIFLRFSIIAIAFSFWVLGLMVFLKSKYTQITTIFFLFCELFANALTLGMISAYGPHWFSSIFNAILWWIGPLLIHTHLLLIEIDENLLFRFLSRICYWVAALLCILNFVNILSPENRGTHFIQYAWLGVTLALAVLIMIKESNHNQSLTTRNNARIIGVTAFIAIFPFLTFSILPEIFFHKLIIPYEISFLALPVLPLGYSYTILHNRLIDFEQHINRNATNALSYIVTSVIFVTCYLGIFQLFIHNTQTEQIVIIGISILMILVIQPIQRFIQHKLEKLFYGGWYDDRNAAQQISQALIQARGNTHSIAQTLCYTLQKTLQLEYVNLVLSDGNFISTIYPKITNIATIENNAKDAFSKLFENIITSGQLAGAGTDLHKYIAGSEKDKSIITGKDPHYWVLLGGKQSNQGLLVLGARYGGGTYIPRDLEVMEIVLHQAGVALENAHLLEELQTRNQQVKSLHHQLINAREEERKRISRDIHDKIIQTLVSMNFQLSSTRSATDHRTKVRLSEIQDELRISLKELRLICADLRPPTLDALGLIPAIQTRVDELRDLSTADISLEFIGFENVELSESVNVCIYRFLQEGLINIYKHSQASIVSVSLNVVSEKKEIHCVIQDDGIGFIPPTNLAILSNQHHFGLIGIQEQIEAVGGQMMIESNPREGCRLIAIIRLFNTSGETHYQIINKETN